MARELGISDNVLYRWRTEERQAESQCRTRQVVRAEQDELTRLKRENETLRKERDLLTRAATFFARESPCDTARSDPADVPRARRLGGRLVRVAFTA